MLTIRQEISPNGKSGVFYDGGREEIGVLILSLRGGRQDDEAIHRVLGERGRVCLFGYWFTVDRHGLFALAMTRLVFLP